MGKFTDGQNEIFGKLFSELQKTKQTFETKAHTVIDMNNENFTMLYYSTTITGTEDELAKVDERAKYLGLKI